MSPGLMADREYARTGIDPDCNDPDCEECKGRVSPCAAEGALKRAIIEIEELKEWTAKLEADLRDPLDIDEVRPKLRKAEYRLKASEAFGEQADEERHELRKRLDYLIDEENRKSEIIVQLSQRIGVLEASESRPPPKPGHAAMILRVQGSEPTTRIDERVHWLEAGDALNDPKYVERMADVARADIVKLLTPTRTTESAIQAKGGNLE